MIDPNAFQKVLLDWVSGIRKTGLPELVAIDGKTLRRSFDRAKGKNALHVLSAFSCSQKLVLAQVKTEEKSNEITAIPELLAMLNLENCIVSIDAMGTQKTVVDAIRERKADYVLCVKGNQGTLHESLKEHFEDLDKSKTMGFAKYETDFFESAEESGHGRKELRRVTASTTPLWKPGVTSWKDLQTVAKIDYERFAKGVLKTETRYYISSLALNAKNIYESVRSHWKIENSLHWVLDVSFGEDQCRKRRGHASFNFSILRKLTLNLLRLDTTPKTSIKRKRKIAGWDDQFLLRVLGVH